MTTIDPLGSGAPTPTPTPTNAPRPAPTGESLYGPAPVIGAAAGRGASAWGPMPDAPPTLDPAAYRPALRRVTAVAAGIALLLVACLAVALVGWGMHRAAQPAAPPGGRVARGVVRSSRMYAEATVYEVRLRGTRDVVVVPRADEDLRRGQEVHVSIAASGRPVEATPVTWTGLALVGVAGVVGLFALLAAIARVPSALRIRRQFAGGLVLSDAQPAGSVPTTSLNVGRTVLLSLVGSLFGAMAVSYRRNQPQGPARLIASRPYPVVLFLEAPRKVASMQRSVVYLPAGPAAVSARGVFDATNGRIVRVRLKPLR